MELRDRILEILARDGAVRAPDIAVQTGVSRAYAHRVLQQLEKEGRIALVGRSNRAQYVPATPEAVAKAKRGIRRVERVYRRDGLSEDDVLRQIDKETGILMELPKNVSGIVDYAFTEMLNNAIDHSRSSDVRVVMSRSETDVRFAIVDHGVGIFQNLITTQGLKSEMEAIQQLVKGKQTTAPEAHSGHGIFFTSRVADLFTIQSGQKKIIFNNVLPEPDVFTRTVSGAFKGTSVRFQIATDSQREMGSIFRGHTSEEYEFDTTSFKVHLYKVGANYLARSQARRLTAGLESFRKITLDFADIPSVGQAFADEIFRVWQNRHPDVEITVEQANEDVTFMIRRAQAAE